MEENEVQENTIKRPLNLQISPLRKKESEPEKRKIEPKINRNEAFEVLQSYFRQFKEINQVTDRHTDIPRLMRVFEEYEKKKTQILMKDPQSEHLIKFAEIDFNFKVAQRRREKFLTENR